MRKNNAKTKQTDNAYPIDYETLFNTGAFELSIKIDLFYSL